MYTWLKPKWLRKLGPGDLVNYYYTQMQRDIDIVKLGTNLSLQLFMLLLFALLLIKEKKKKKKIFMMLFCQVGLNFLVHHLFTFILFFQIDMSMLQGGESFLRSVLASMETVYLNRNPTAKAILELVQSVDSDHIFYDHLAFRTFGVFLLIFNFVLGLNFLCYSLVTRLIYHWSFYISLLPISIRLVDDIFSIWTTFLS